MSKTRRVHKKWNDDEWDNEDTSQERQHKREDKFRRQLKRVKYDEKTRVEDKPVFYDEDK